MSLKIKKIKLFFITFIISLIIFTIKYFINNNMQSISKKLRNLITYEDVIERCNKSDKSFLDKYKTNYRLKEEIKNLNDNQETLKKLLIKFSLDEGKYYLKRLIIPIILLIVDILLFILWICFCSCFCCPPCCCPCLRNKITSCVTCSLTFLHTINIFFCFFLCFFSIVGIFRFTNTFRNSMNNTACSLYKLVFHFLEGTKDDYPKLTNWERWNSNDFETIDLIINEYKKIENKAILLQQPKEILDLPDDYRNKFEHYYILINEQIENINKLINNFSLEEMEKTRNDIDNFYEIFRIIKNDFLDKINDFMKDVFDKYIIIILYALFGIIGILSLLSIILILIYTSYKIKCFTIIYDIIWNIQMILVITSCLIGIFLISLSFIGKDLIPIFQYIRSEENLLSENPLLFKADKSIIKNLDICLNNHGNIDISIEKPRLVFNFTDIENNNDLLLKEKNNKLATENFEEFTDLIINYETVILISEKYLQIEKYFNSLSSDSITNCQFIYFDINIIIDEIKNTFGENLIILGLCLLAEDVITVITIFCGIISVNIMLGYNQIEKTNLNKDKLSDKSSCEEPTQNIIKFLPNRKADTSNFCLKINNNGFSNKCKYNNYLS